MHRVVIVGGGFAGLHAALHLKRVDVSVTLIDARNFHLFQPLLYQVATASLSPANIAAPLRNILKRHKNTTVLMGRVTDIDTEKRRVIMEDAEVPYDTLMLATGSRHHYYGRHEWSETAPGLKTVVDALNIRQRILMAFEAAEREADPEVVKRLLTFVIVGAGPTGVEMAGALCEVSRLTLKNEFRNIDPGLAKIVLIEGSQRILPMYPESLSRHADDTLSGLGAIIRKGVMVVGVSPEGVTLKTDTGEEFIPAGNVIWAAGVLASGLGKKLAAKTGAETDASGRVQVDDYLNISGHPEIFVAGDLAHCKDKTGKPLPAVAPVAVQQGRHVARAIEYRLAGKEVPCFRYLNLGSMATIGRSHAVAELPWCRLWGFPAWVSWLFIHLLKLVEFESRILVLMQWGWNYFTWRRTARLITEISSIAYEQDN